MPPTPGFAPLHLGWLLLGLCAGFFLGCVISRCSAALTGMLRIAELVVKQYGFILPLPKPTTSFGCPAQLAPTCHTRFAAHHLTFSARSVPVHRRHRRTRSNRSGRAEQSISFGVFVATHGGPTAPSCRRRKTEESFSRYRVNVGQRLYNTKDRRLDPYSSQRIGEARHPGPVSPAERDRALHALERMGL